MGQVSDTAGTRNDRELGSCPVCVRPVRFDDTVVRVADLVVHVRCAIARRARKPGLLHLKAA